MPSAGALAASDVAARDSDGRHFGFFGRLYRALGVTGGLSLDERETAPNGLGWAPVLALQSSLCVVLCALGVSASLNGAAYAIPLFYVGCAAVFFPAACRLVHPRASRNERLLIVLIATLALFLIRMARAPGAFVDHDEFLHWLTAIDIEEQRRLFTPNPLLPVSSLYPGLELATTAIVDLTGLSIFAAATILLGVARMAFIASLFYLFERLIGSARAASIACLVFMGSSTFIVFDAHFSYESLAVPLVAMALLSDVVAKCAPRRGLAISAAVTLPALAALSVTHHTSAYFLAAIFCGVAVFGGLRPRNLIVAGFAVALPVIWSRLVGDPTVGYLGPVFQDGLREAERLLNHAPGRQLFVSDAGVVAPAWQRYTTFASVGLICLGLSFGFIRSARLSLAPLWKGGTSVRGRLAGVANPYLLVLTLATVVFPVSVLFRLTRAGWEIGNRMGALSFFGIAPVIAIGVVLYWQGASRNTLRALALGLAGSAVFVGGIISGQGSTLLTPQHFQVSADNASIEPMGLATARWTKEWLGAGNMFAADRINRLLLATYGRQDVATTLEDPRDSSIAILSPKLGPSEREALRDVGIQYILADLRITSALPVVGVYFDGAAGDQHYNRPPSPKYLLKFDRAAGVNRVFDNGYTIIYDVRALTDER